MTVDAVSRSIRLCASTWRVQVFVVGISSLVAAATITAVPAMHAIAICALIVLAASAISARVATVAARLSVRDLRDLMLALAVQLGLLWGSVVLLMVGAAFISKVTTIVPLIAAFILVPLCIGLVTPTLLIIGAVASGHRILMLRSVIYAAFRSNHALYLHGVGLALIVVCSLVILPFIVVALVLLAHAGVLAFLPLGFCVVAMAFPFACASNAMWILLCEVSHVSIESTREEWFEPAPSGILTGEMTDDINELRGDLSWVRGQSWNVLLDARGTWGAWIRLVDASHLALKLQLSAGHAPSIAIADSAGSWQNISQVSAESALHELNLTSGDWYLQLSSNENEPQQVSVEILVAQHTILSQN